MTVHASQNNERPRAPGVDPRIPLLRELADPLRLRVIDRLGHVGPGTVTQLAGELRVPLPQLSNHLRRLREAGLISAQRTGRQVVYELADPGLETLLPLLDSITGRVGAGAGERNPSGIPSRTCYAHLGGEIGVSIYRALLAHGALRAGPDGIVELAPEASRIFAALSVDLPAAHRGRQRFAFECLDATVGTPHLAGALGDATAAALTEQGWIARASDSREYSLTPAGRRGLKRALGIETVGARPRRAS